MTRRPARRRHIRWLVLVLAILATWYIAPHLTHNLPETAPFAVLPNGIAIYFSNTYHNNSNVGIADTTNIDRRLAGFIESAERSLDCALFEIQSERIANALIAAHMRGVTVRIVAEHDYRKNDEMLSIVHAGIPVVYDNRNKLMHNKFLVADSDRVWTGSFNATDNGAYKNNNNAMVIPSRELAENYSAEFAEMFLRKQFGPGSESVTPHTVVQVDSITIYNYFSPDDEIPAKLYRLLRTAKQTIHFMAFSMTDDSIGNILAERYAAGVDVEGILEGRGTGTQYSELKRLRNAGIPTLADGNRFAMHHKVIIIDGVWTVTGSYNFSISAARDNDENILMIQSVDVARAYEEEYTRMKDMADTPL